MGFQFRESSKSEKNDSPKVDYQKIVDHITRSKANFDADQFVDQGVYGEECRKFLDRVPSRMDKLFDANLSELCKELSVAGNEAIRFIGNGLRDDALKVAVGGGYSAGKSSFLNSLLGLKGALPTGINPVSMINTFVCSTDGVKEMTVVGKNKNGKDGKGCLVKLNRSVLECIQHSDNEGNAKVSSELDTLYIDIPLLSDKPYLRNVTFVDTPGYNNSDNVNEENGKKDRDTAVDAMRQVDVLFWIVDIEVGTLTRNDIALLNEVSLQRNEGEEMRLPIVIVFNKSDKKPEDEILKIMKSAAESCQRNLKVAPLDIVSYSSRSCQLHSLNGNTFADIIAKAKKQMTINYNIDFLAGFIEANFDEVISAVHKRRNLSSTAGLEEFESLLNESKSVVSSAFKKGCEDAIQTRNDFIAKLPSLN